MKRVIFALATCLLSAAVGLSQDSTAKSAGLPTPLIGVPDFEVRTGDQLTRVAPGSYTEENVKIGTDSKRETGKENGKTIDSSSSRDVYEKQLRRNIEYSPGEWNLPPQAGKIAADEVAAVLIQSKSVRVLSRSAASFAIRENERQLVMRFSPQELVNAFRDSKADYIFLGSVSGFRVDEITGRTYGVDFSTISTRVTLDLKLVSTATGEVAYQGAPAKTVTLPLPAGVKSTAIYDWESTLRAAVREVATDVIAELDNFGKKGNDDIETIRVRIESSPPGADILVDGDFLGNTPLNASLKSGRQIIRLELSGYQQWERTVNVIEGVAIKPKLTKLMDSTAK